MGDEQWLHIYSALVACALSTNTSGSSSLFRRLVGLQGRLGWITALCFLLYRTVDETEPCVHRFLLHTMPVLLQQLSRSTQLQRVKMYGHTRGRIDWPSTYKTRYHENSNEAAYICLPSGRYFDRPENQLLVFMLHQIQFCLDCIPASMMDWQAWGTMLLSEQGPLHVGHYLAVLTHRVRSYRSHIHLREVELPTHIKEQHLFAARTAKNIAYADLAGLYQLYHTLADSPTWELWASLLRATLPLSPGIERVAQLWH